MSVNYPDIAVVVLVVLLGLRGGVRGFLAEMSGLAGLLLGLFLIRSFFSPAVRWLNSFIPPYAAPAAAIAAMLLAGLLAVSVLVRLLRTVIKASLAVWPDRLLGCGAGLCKGILLSAALACGAAFFVPHLAQVQDSRLIPSLLDLARQCGAALGIFLPSSLSNLP